METDIVTMEKEKIACYDDIARLRAEYALLKSKYSLLINLQSN